MKTMKIIKASSAFQDYSGFSVLSFEITLSTNLEHLLGRFNKEEDKKIDVYAFGITLYEILFGIDAWEGMKLEEIREQVLNGNRPVITADMLKSFQEHMAIIEVMSKCWQQEASARPDFDHICQAFETSTSKLDTSTGVTLVNSL